ncbi:hypothetical protein HanPSC8_Chr05g0206491 [Helianthus annuus]|nr:hypothetical protein HanPSC8_Chr05g0206491 [Helianthus annuus]
MRQGSGYEHGCTRNEYIGFLRNLSPTRNKRMSDTRTSSAT